MASPKKRKILMKRMITQTVILAVVTLMIMAVSYFISDVNEKAKRNQMLAQQALQTITAQIDVLKQKKSEDGLANQIYLQLISGGKNTDFAVSPEIIYNQTLAAKANYEMQAQLEFEDGESTDFNHPDIDVIKQKARVYRGVITVSQAMSDRDVFGFIRRLQLQGSGVIKVSEFSLSRRNDLSVPALTQISRGEAADIVRGSIGFEWYGYEPAEVEKDPANDGKIPPTDNPTNVIPGGPNG